MAEKLQGIAEDPKLKDIPVVFRIEDGDYDNREERHVDKDMQVINRVEITMHNETWTPVQLIIVL